MSTADLISGCNSGENMARKGDVRDATSPPADTSLAEQALLMWLRWNAAYELLTSKMFEQRQNLEELQHTLDLADELRRSAVQLTQKILGK